MTSLPPWYVKGHYRAVKVPGGYAVRAPGGQLVTGEPTERPAAVARADKFNGIRASLAHRP